MDGDAILEQRKTDIIIMVAMTAIFYALPAIFKIKNVFTDVIYSAHHYIYYSPAYIHTLLIFAFCNVDDLSWGTKGADDHKVRNCMVRMKLNWTISRKIERF